MADAVQPAPNDTDALEIGSPVPQDSRAWVAPAHPAQPLEDPQEAAKWSRLRLRWFTSAGNGVDTVVTGSASSTAVTFARVEPNTKYGVIVVPSWSTTVYVATSDKLTTGFTAHFGTNSPGGGGTISWATFRSEDS